MNDDHIKKNVANVMTGAILMAVTAVIIGLVLAGGWRLVTWVGGF